MKFSNESNQAILNNANHPEDFVDTTLNGIQDQTGTVNQIKFTVTSVLKTRKLVNEFGEYQVNTKVVFCY